MTSNRKVAFAACLLLIGRLALAQRSITVSSAGEKDAFASVQAAIDSIPEDATQPSVIVIRPGSYRELVHVPAGKKSLTLRGADPDPTKTIVTYDLFASFMRPGTTQPVGTDGTATFLVEAPDFTAENLTFANSAGEKGQAVAA